MNRNRIGRRELSAWLSKIGIFAVVVIALLTPLEVDARGPSKKSSSTESTQNSEQTLMATPLKIDHDCQPNSFGTKLYLKTLNDDETKRFWLGQRYAVERTYKETVEAARLRRLSDAADARISAIETQRDAANMASIGLRPLQFPELDQFVKDSNASLQQLDAEIARNNYQWFQKCYRFADERSR